MKKLFLIVLLLIAYSASYAQFAEVSTRLKQKLSSMSPMEYTPVLILLKDRVNIEALDAQLYSQKANAQYRAKTIIEALMEKARTTQGPILSALESKKMAGKVRSYEAFWITNMILVDANAETILDLTRRADVDQIDLDGLLDYDKPVSRSDAPEGTEASEIGLKVIKANKLWEIGITGLGRLVMNIDTGVEGTHPALSARWRGNNGQPWWRAWFDKNGSTTTPTDCDDHGTHTMGIMCGRSAAGDTVGVAPNAQWIAARTICSSPHTSNSIAAFQWAMNPDSNASTTSDMPDAIGNSWYDPDVSNECSGIYKTTLDALEAAGIAVVFSCGNSGPSGTSITKPKNINTNSVNAFTVGSINGNSSFPYPISSYSSRGPSVCGGTGSLLIKPEVCAPGENVRSSVRGGGYTTMSGTSMACPHIVGAVALLREVAPNLTGKQILEALYNTAVQLPVGGVENNDYGKGVIDVYAAFQSLGPMISHTPLPNTENLTGPCLINSEVTSVLSGVSTAKLLWSRNNTNITDSVVMTKGTGNNWSASIPGNGTAAVYRYFIKAIDSTDRVGTNPPGAPAVLNVFTASPDTSKPIITHTTIADVPKTTWPATVTAVVTDNIGLDSVWVKWYKNSTVTGIKMFKLLNTGENNFAAQFNSANSDVNVNDSIFYRVFARDNSLAHNTDSTTLRTFKIIAQATACIGTGTSSTSYPFYTLYEDSRTQMLYKSSEIIAGGGAAGFINKIGFTILTVGSPAMNGFSVKMQTIASSTISSWTTTGWTEVYTSSSYSPAGTGLQYITLTTPYYYNGTGNLLVEVCFNNTTWSSNTTVAGTSQTGTVVHNHVDNSTGCNLTATSTAANRPNVCLVINTAVGVNPSGANVPNVYSLSQNYPNPFNPSTKINFAIPKQGLVTLKIYDVLGREVRILVNDVKSAGNYTVDFNASEFSSGVYFYRIQANDFSDVKRMLLVK
ncbi:MAG: S8 family serine peptidase [Ignavibacteria bacterium]